MTDLHHRDFVVIGASPTEAWRCGSLMVIEGTNWNELGNKRTGTGMVSSLRKASSGANHGFFSGGDFHDSKALVSGECFGDSVLRRDLELRVANASVRRGQGRLQKIDAAELRRAIATNEAARAAATTVGMTDFDLCDSSLRLCPARQPPAGGPASECCGGCWLEGRERRRTEGGERKAGRQWQARSQPQFRGGRIPWKTENRGGSDGHAFAKQRVIG